jgi:hypothetical protein
MCTYWSKSPCWNVIFKLSWRIRTLAPQITTAFPQIESSVSTGDNVLYFTTCVDKQINFKDTWTIGKVRLPNDCRGRQTYLALPQ